ncbi:MAG: FtsQ-type POTRA domain-containing protein [Patescibacteria group bacterium]
MKDILTSPRIMDMKRKRRVRRIRLNVLIFVLFLSIVYALGYFSSNHRITINRISITGTRILKEEEVLTIVKNALSGKYIKLFSRSNSFIYPKNQIHKELTTKFPRIEKLSINRDNWNTLHIDISERFGSSLYCGKNVPDEKLEVGENCYFVNNDGYIFDKAPYFSGNIYLKYYIGLPEGVGDPMGKQILSPDIFHKYIRFIDGLTTLGFKPIYVVIGGGDNSIYLDHIEGVTAPKIIFTNENDMDNILDNLSLSMNKPEFANEIKGKYTTLLYIDLRFKNKVLYKFE